jgi:hypothetical protein
MRKRWVIAASVPVVLVAIPMISFTLLGNSDESRLRTVRSTFVGLDRAEAHRRLRAMALASRRVPPGDDLAIDFAHAPRPIPTAWRGACGAHPSLLVQFSGSRVVRVDERVVGLACI